MKIEAKATIYDIAHRAEASPSTVSSVLNGTWKRRRISVSTVERIMKIARDMGYSANLQARALRTTKTGLVGMILPQHDNTFFSVLSQVFTEEARERGMMPATISTRRNRKLELDSISKLMAYSVDALVIVGASSPNELNLTCKSAGVPHVFIDQPCDNAPSVVSDNTSGFRELTSVVLDRAGEKALNEIILLGGDSHLYATHARIEGFRDALLARGVRARPEQILACGYRRSDARNALAKYYQSHKRLPLAIVVNSMGCFEGTLEFLDEVSDEEIGNCQFGVWDHDPVGALCRFPVPMMRQRAEELVRKAFVHLDAEDTEPSLTQIAPELIMPRAEQLHKKKEQPA